MFGRDVCMPIVGRSTLISSSLNNSPIDHVSVYLLHKTIVSKMDKNRRSFFWQGGETKKKYHLLNWGKICKSKEKRWFGDQEFKENEC